MSQSQCPLIAKNKNVRTLVIPKGALNPNDTHVIEIPDDNDVKSFVLPTRRQQSRGSSQPYRRTVAEPAEYQPRPQPVPQQYSQPRVRIASQYNTPPSSRSPSSIGPPPQTACACSQMQSGRLLAATTHNFQSSTLPSQRIDHNPIDCPLHSMHQYSPYSGYGIRPPTSGYSFARPPSQKSTRTIIPQYPVATSSRILNPDSLMETNESYSWLPPNTSRSESFLSCSQPFDDEDDDIDKVIEEKIEQIMKPFLRSLIKSANSPDSTKTCGICGKNSNNHEVEDNRMKRTSSRVKFDGKQESGCSSGLSSRQDSAYRNERSKLSKAAEEDSTVENTSYDEHFDGNESAFNSAFMTINNSD